MRILLLILLTSCTYQGVIVSNDTFNQTSRAKINDTFYIVVEGYYEQGDTLWIDRTSLRVINKEIQYSK